VSLRVVVADDQALVRAGFCGIVAATPGLDVVGEAGTGADAVEVTRRTRPDVVLMDVRMPELDGIEATRQITGSPGLASRVLILTTFDLDEYVYSALHAGASGFLLKSTEPAELVNAIRVVAAGDALLAPSVTRRLVEEFTRRPAPVSRPVTPEPPPTSRLPAVSLDAITGREREVLALIATGLSNSEIAARLSISEATAKTHVGHLLTKLNARDRVHLVILAFQAGLGQYVLAQGATPWNPTVLARGSDPPEPPAGLRPLRLRRGGLGPATNGRRRSLACLSRWRLRTACRRPWRPR